MKAALSSCMICRFEYVIDVRANPDIIRRIRAEIPAPGHAELAA